MRRLGVVALVACLGLVNAAPSLAAPYESFIDVETDEDLYDLVVAGIISEDTYESLSDLLARGVDINTASREELFSLPNVTYVDVDSILDYRKTKGRVTTLSELATAGVIEERLLLSIAAYLIVSEAGVLEQLRGNVLMRTRIAVSDRDVPPFYARARLQAGRRWTVGGLLMSTRQRLGAVTYDAARDALSAAPATLQAHLPKVFVRYQTEAVTAILGSYRVGFAQRLVFDNTSDYSPNGIVVDNAVYSLDDMTLECRRSDGEIPAVCERSEAQRVTRDFRWRDGLTGAALTSTFAVSDQTQLQLSGWVSYTRRDVYQYYLARPDRCADPRDDDDAACASPSVYVTQAPSSAPADRYKYETLPNVFGEALGGVNIGLAFTRRTYMAATAYGVAKSARIDGLALDYQESAGRPSGNVYGAVGIAGGWGHGPWDLGAEVALSFDQMNVQVGPTSGGGGPAAIVRGTFTQKQREVEATLRYYDTNYVNPYARPLSAPDRLEGLRARDELGVTLRYRAERGALSLHAFVDAWTTPSNELKKARAFLRSDYQVDKWWRVGLWLDGRSENLQNEDVVCSGAIDEDGDSVGCEERGFGAAARVRFTPNKKTSLFAQVQERIVKADTETPLRHDVSAWLRGSYAPTTKVRLSARVRWLSESFGDTSNLEDSLRMLAEAGHRLRSGEWVRLRMEAFWLLDQRDSTAERTPNPELSFWLTYAHRFR